MMKVKVRPSGDWWLVDADGLAAPMVFASGARAQQTARQLAIACSGLVGATLEVEQRDGRNDNFLCLPVVTTDEPRFVAIAAGVTQ